MIFDPEDCISNCSLCNTLIVAGDQVADSEYSDVFYHADCQAKAALDEMAKISQTTGQYDYSADWGND